DALAGDVEVFRLDLYANEPPAELCASNAGRAAAHEGIKDGLPKIREPMHKPFLMHEGAAAGVPVRRPVARLRLWRYARYNHPTGLADNWRAENVSRFVSAQDAAEIAGHDVLTPCDLLKA